MTTYYRNGWRSKFVLNGKQIHVPGSPFPSESSALEAEKRHRDYLLARRTDETCASFAERWLREWPRPAASTRRQYKDATKQFAAHFGPTPLGDVERLSARTWALSVPRYVSRTVRTMYEDARNVGLVEHNPFENLRLPGNRRRRKVTVPSLEEYAELIKSTTVLGGYGPEFRSLLAFTAWTGVRSGELMAMEWGDLDGEEIHVRRSRKRDGTVGLPKNGEERTIIFPPPARVLEDVPRRPGLSGAVSSREATGPSETTAGGPAESGLSEGSGISVRTFPGMVSPVHAPLAEFDPLIFHSPRGFPLDQGSLYWAWREVRATAGLRHVRFHDLRHFCATQLLDMGVDHFAVSIQLGHTDNGVEVMRTYGHPSETAARRRLLEAFADQEAGIGSRTTTQALREGSNRA